MSSPANVLYYQFAPNEAVYAIDTCSGKPFVTHGTVVRVRVEVLVTGHTIAYDVRLADNTGTKSFVETDIFGTKSDALVEYNTRV